jgi:hypothetical protein
MPEIGTSGLLSGVGKRGGAGASVPAPNLDSTPVLGLGYRAPVSHCLRNGLLSAAPAGAFGQVSDAKALVSVLSWRAPTIILIF